VGVGVTRSRRFLGGVGFLRKLGIGVGVEVGFFCPTPTLEVQMGSLLHHTPQLRIPAETVQLLQKLLLKQRILAVCHDFHWVLVASKLLTVKLHSFYVKQSESEILERSESDILPPTPQPW